ncbi:DUF502 domain-containing protein [Marinobacterium rhizophilum]|uniref:DUF502 domain-containing protein n=1 Tax=Marinobacterium rhizophilum TaxID=420402 RepID=A0ABY5HKF2_9GAMM|nr:DUF502 domain-containing protein [Marinobacterium rhizophilum]UTW12870.1 DUF502 domain-containing protein [Marinobacterium rhizophilum]
MFKFFGRNVLTGLITTVPIALTLYLVYWLVVSVEVALGALMRLMLPAGLYVPGMGLLVGLLLMFAVGLLMHAYLVQRLFSMAETLLYSMPLVKSIYRAIRDFFNYFSPENHKEFEQVVLVTIGDTGMRLIGFVTQAQPERLPAGVREDDNVLVYLPLSYMIGGYAVLMPRSAVRPLDMSMEEAMRFTLTAGVTGVAVDEHRPRAGQTRTP